MVMAVARLRARRVCSAARAATIGAWLLRTDPATVKVANGQVIVADGASVTLREVARAWYLQPQNSAA